MNFEEMDFLSYGDEREEKGEKKGEKRGEDKFAMLVSKLIQAGRYEDLEKAANDRQYRAELFEEYNQDNENDEDCLFPESEINWGPDVGGEVIQ